MTYLMSFGKINNTVILLVFGVIILIIGIYTMYTVKEMKETKEPPAWLLADQDRARLKEPEAFCVAIRPYTILLGIGCILFGVYDVFEYIFLKTYLTKLIGVVAIVLVVILFFVGFYREKGKFVR